MNTINDNDVELQLEIASLFKMQAYSSGVLRIDKISKGFEIGVYQSYEAPF